MKRRRVCPVIFISASSALNIPGTMSSRPSANAAATRCGAPDSITSKVERINRRATSGTSRLAKPLAKPSAATQLIKSLIPSRSAPISLIDWRYMSK